MPEKPICEVYRRSDEDLPPERKDIIFEYLDESAAETLARERIIVLSKFLDPEAAEDVRSTSRNFLFLNTPMRAARKAIDKTLPGIAERFPLLARRPLTMPMENSWIPQTTYDAFKKVDQTNEALYKYPAIARMYGGSPHFLSTVLFSHLPSGAWFPRHQDSPHAQGIGFAIQSDESLWHAESHLTVAGADDFTFRASMGDLVLILERKDDIKLGRPLSSNGEYKKFVTDGSLVHTGKGLSGRHRYGVSLFSD